MRGLLDPTKRSMLERDERMATMVFELGERLATYFDHKVHPTDFKNEIIHEEEGLRLLLNFNQGVLKIFRGTEFEPIIIMTQRDCEILLDFFKKAERDPEKVDYRSLERALIDLHFQITQLIKAAA